MKNQLILSAALYLIVSVISIASTSTTGFKSSERFVQVSPKNHKYLQLSDGTPYIPVGPNICWPRFETDE
jgi:hypothetical protein